MSDPDKPWDDLAVLGPLEVNNLLYINANLYNGFNKLRYNNITEYCIDEALDRGDRSHLYVDPRLMRQIASKYKNEKKKSISLSPNDKKKGKGRNI